VLLTRFSQPLPTCKGIVSVAKNVVSADATAEASPSS
jgi:hypothetical protein